MNRETRRSLIVIGTLLALAVAATVAVVNLDRRPSYEVGSPEAAVQGFVQAVIDGDAAAALTWVDPAAGCSVVNLSRYQPDDGVTARIERVATSGDTTSVVVDFTESGGDPFDDGWSHRETFGLAHGESGWRLTTTSWFHTACLATK